MTFTLTILDSFSINIENTLILSSPQVKSLGSIFDSMLSFQAHIDAKIHLWNISWLYSTLAVQAAAVLIHSIATSWVDYWNSLLFAPHPNPQTSLNRLQLLQNAAVQIMTHTSSHTSPLSFNNFTGSQWSTDLRCIRNLAPPYLSHLLHITTKAKCFIWLHF